MELLETKVRALETWDRVGAQDGVITRVINDRTPGRRWHLLCPGSECEQVFTKFVLRERCSRRLQGIAAK
jgi:hypothetical protein